MTESIDRLRGAKEVDVLAEIDRHRREALMNSEAMKRFARDPSAVITDTSLYGAPASDFLGTDHELE